MDKGNRSLTDADAKAIATELKKQLFKDLQLEVGRGVIFWAKRVFVLILLILAIYGAFGDRPFVQSIVSSGSGG